MYSQSPIIAVNVKPMLLIKKESSVHSIMDDKKLGELGWDWLVVRGRGGLEGMC
jgi:hypothetical protein